MHDKNKTYTKGDVVVEDIKIGDIQYEYSYGIELVSEVIELPVKSEGHEGRPYWKWKNKLIKKGEHDGEIIEYGVTKGLEHYGPNLYNYPAYMSIDELRGNDESE